MDISHFYAPIVKCKSNDLKALSRLSPGIRASIKPLVELTPVPADRSTDEHLLKFIHYVMKYQPDGELFVDFYGFLPSEKISTGLSAAIAGFRVLRKQNRPVTPTFGLGRDDEVWALLRKEIESFGKGFCFRLEPDDLDDQSEESWQEIIERSATLGVEPARTDLLIDLRHLGFANVVALKELVLDFLSFAPQSNKYRSIIVSGSCAPKHVGGFPADGIGEVDRKELRLWIHLRLDISEEIPLVFSDYGVIHPDFSDMGPNKNSNGKIRYTVGDKTHIFRGHKLFDPSDFAQYHVLAERVRSSAYYRGADFSFGDRYIDDCADFNDGPGNMGNWVLADMNHHIQYSTRQLEALVANVTAGLTEVQVEQLIESV
jgi:hypothetical protein